jgi:hypothetical protein
MSWSSFLLICALIIAVCVQYGLAIFAIRDLRKREHLRGANKVTWSLIVLCIPFIGPLLYTMLATDGLPIPRPSPSDTWPGKRWRSVRSVKRVGESLMRGTEIPRENDPWEYLPASHDPLDSEEPRAWRDRS